MSKKIEIKISPQDELRMRVLKVKTIIPKTFDYTPIYQYEFGEQSEESLNKIRMVWNLRSTDEKITRNLETIAENIKHG